MAEVNKLYESLLPETQQRLTQDWMQSRYSGEGSSAQLNRFGLDSSKDGGISGTLQKGDGGDVLGSAGAGVSAGGVAGAAVGSIVPGIGTAIGGAVGAAIGGIGGAVAGAWSSKSSYSWTPGKQNAGNQWEQRLDRIAPEFSSDPYKATLAMMFMSKKNNDPYQFSRNWASKKKGWNRRGRARARYHLDEGMRPGETQEKFVNESEGFLDWTKYAGSGPGLYRKWAPTWIENMLSRSLYAKHRDVWDLEAKRKGTTKRKFLDLANRADNFGTGTPGYIKSSDLGPSA